MQSLFRLLQYVPTNFTHPRHYAENGLRLLEEGDGVEGSSGFPGSVCLHPLHGPPPLCASSLVLLSSPLLAQRHRVCGAPGNRHGKSPNLLLLQLLLLQRWMDGCTSLLCSLARTLLFLI